MSVAESGSREADGRPRSGGAEGDVTLVVERRAAEVWRVLGAGKTEFGKFGGVLDKVHRQLSTATRTIEEAGTRRRVMERKLL